MSVNIPCGSSNPIGFKMPRPSSPAPPPSSETKSAVKQALHARERPEHLTIADVGDSADISRQTGVESGAKKGMENAGEVDMTAKEGVEGGRRS
ncbi:hypothetical protein TWF696_002050 [Orbilia brochopaga]|uniref:Uncharacterized protein n=1 Tax=Orbilia brochopaga TaxID=3140254 RepID=A0AAV9U771_9PEZI